MNERVVRQTVTLLRPFSLQGVDGTFPPGAYEVETSEEQLEGLSFVAYRRVGTSIRLPGQGASNASWQLYEIEPRELSDIQARDAGLAVSESAAF